MHLAKRLPHECDGLIFTPLNLPYIAGTCQDLLKWKDASMNTADFSVEFIFPHNDSSKFHAKLISGNLPDTLHTSYVFQLKKECKRKLRSVVLIQLEIVTT